MVVRLKSHVHLLGLVALAGLAIGLVLLLRTELGPLRTARAVATSVEMQAVLADLVDELQHERGLTTIWLASAVSNAALRQQQDRTDAAAIRAVARGVLQDNDLSAVAAHRHRIAVSATDAAQLHAVYTAAIDSLLHRFASGARGIELSELRALLLDHMALLRAKEQLGELRAIVAGQLALGTPNEAEIRRALQQLAVFDATVAAYLEETDAAHAGRMRGVMESAAMRTLREWIAKLAATPSERRLEPGAQTAVAWFEVASAAADKLRVLAALSIDEARGRAGTLVAASRIGLFWHAAILILGWAASCWLVFLSLRRLLGTIQRLTADTQALLGRIESVTGVHVETPPRDLDAGFMDLVGRVDQLSTQANTDALTGLLNRHGLALLFRTERLRALRHSRALSLVLLDLDHFKRINDESGHAAGDGVLHELAALLRRIVRAEDIIARWGGEEFVLVTPECDESSAAAVAEKLRAAVAAHDFRLPRRITASFGVVQLEAGDDLERLVARADSAMYRAKALGRNRVCRASTPGGDEPPRLRVVPR